MSAASEGEAAGQRSTEAQARELVRQLAGQAGDTDLQELEEALAGLEEAGRQARVDATVTSAVPLDDEQRASVERRLRETYGSELPVRYQVDASILGGLVVRVGDRYLDASVATRLGQLRRELVGAASV